MGPSARFDISLYTREGSVHMAKAWVRKMSFFRSAWEDAGSDWILIFPEAALQGYVEDASFTEWAGSLVQPRVLQRLAKLRALRPQEPQALVT